MAEIPLRRKDGSLAAVVIVDDEDFEDLSQFCWYLGSRGYAMRQYREPPDSSGRRRNRAELLHRRVLGLARGNALECDHINRDKLDNRRCNLRAVTHAENEQNKTACRAQSGVRHVHWVKARNCWKVHMVVDGHQYTKQGFASVGEAAKVAAVMAQQLKPFAP